LQEAVAGEIQRRPLGTLIAPEFDAEPPRSPTKPPGAAVIEPALLTEAEAPAPT
jgi:hypothetical protein